MTKIKLSEIRAWRDHDFQVMPVSHLRWDSPFFVYIPYSIRDERYNHVRDESIAWRDLYRDTAECEWCRTISPDHLKAIVERWDANNEKIEVDLSECDTLPSTDTEKDDN